jgi:NitT/TauT family transport system permease protein
VRRPDSDRSEQGAVRLLRQLGAIAWWLVVWQVIAWAVHNSVLLAGPLETLVTLAAMVGTVGFWCAIGTTFVHIAVGFTCSFALAVVMGACAWRLPVLRRLLVPLISFVKSVPVVCVIVLLLMWMGSAHVSVLAVGLMVFPPVYFSVLEGLDQVDADMITMMDTFRVPWGRRVRYYFVPAVMPYVAAAAKVVVGIGWKSGVAAEVIGVPNGTVGAGVYLAKIGLDSARLFAWTFAIVGLSAGCEKAFIRLLDHIEGAAGSIGDKTGSSVRELRQGERGSAVLGDVQAAPTGASVVSADGLAAPTGTPAAPTSAPTASMHTPAAPTNPLAASSSEPEAAVVFDHMAFSYVGHPVFSDVSMTWWAGGRYCLMGPSGAGKTTLLELASGLLTPTAGEVRGPGHVSWDFQENRLLEQCSAWDNVIFACDGATASSVLERMKTELDALLQTDSAGLPVAACSGGMLRKVALVRALASAGDALILDEPFAGLDAASHVRAAEAVVRNLGGRTLLVSTHDERDAALLGAGIVRIDRSFSGVCGDAKRDIVMTPGSTKLGVKSG